MNPLTIWLKDKATDHAVEVCSPNAWQGQLDCVVGPFSSEEVAEHFVGRCSDFGDYELSERIFAHQDAWYVEIKPLGL